VRERISQAIREEEDVKGVIPYCIERAFGFNKLEFLTVKFPLQRIFRSPPHKSSFPSEDLNTCFSNEHRMFMLCSSVFIS